MPNAAEASAIISALYHFPQSFNIEITPNVSLDVLMIPYSSASAEDSAITDWFFDHDLM